jgi:glutaminyl-peptide cyclotransferase
MKNYNGLVVILLAVLVGSCSSTKEDLFSINESALKAQYLQKESVQLEISNLQSEKIDSVVYSLNGKRIGSGKETGKFEFALVGQKFGFHNLKSKTFFEGAVEIDSTRIEVISDIQPKLLSYEIVNTYPHDTSAYTQGLEFYNGILYEGTGQYEESTLRKTDYKTGKVSQKIDLESKYFGEGITFE